MSFRKRQNGLTLVELLVVVTILVLLVAVVLPLAQPALSGRNVREAARQINTIFERARSEAMATGRSTGIMLVPDATGAQCFQLSMVREKPPRLGETSVALGPVQTFDFDGDDDGSDTEDVLGRPLVFQDLMTNSDWKFLLARVARRMVNGAAVDGAGESFRIRFDHRGREFQGFRVDDDGMTAFVIPESVFDTFPLPPSTLTAIGTPQFTIRVEPRRTAAASIEFPVGSYIDLTASTADGATVDDDGNDGTPQVPVFFAESTTPIKIMFGADGNFEPITINGLSFQSAINLLVARGKNASALDPQLANLSSEGGSLWVNLGDSGRIKTTENIGFQSVTQQPSSVAEAYYGVGPLGNENVIGAVARSVKTGQSMGGQ